MPRFKLTIAYEGTDFHGWQKQEPPGAEPLRTVQGVLEQTISRVLREPIELQGASRTDACVHARGQVAAFTTSAQIPVSRAARAINSRLPRDVRIRKACIVDDAFNPISDAIAKGYRYRIAHGGAIGAPAPLFDRRITSFTAALLDAARMNDAAQRLIGEHDFASFCKLHHGRVSTVRTIHDCRVSAVSRYRLRIDVSGDGFLYNMVRIIAGTLLDVGRGRFEPDDVPGIIEARDRASAGDTLPPEGLCLMWVRYDAAQPA